MYRFVQVCVRYLRKVLLISEGEIDNMYDVYGIVPYHIDRVKFENTYYLYHINEQLTQRTTQKQKR